MSYAASVEAANKYAAAGDYREGAAQFRAALGLMASDDDKARGQLEESLAQCLLNVDGEEEQAEQAAWRAVTLRPTWPEARLTLGRAQLNMGRFWSAAANFVRCVELDPDMQDEVGDDMARASSLARMADERTIRINGVDLKLEQRREGLGAGCVLWECGVVLAKFLDREPLQLAKHVIELGSGCGLAGLAAAALGADVVCTDIADVANGVLAANAARNRESLRGKLEVAVFDWQVPSHLAKFELVLAADCVYNLKSVLPFVSAVSAVIQPKLGKALVAHKRRHKNVDEALVHAFEQANFRLKEIPYDRQDPDFCNKLVTIFEISTKRMRDDR